MPRKPRKVDPQRMKCRILLYMGVSKEEIAQQTGLPMKTISNIHGWVSGPSGKTWLAKNQTVVFPAGPPPPAPPAPAPVGAGPPRRGGETAVEYRL